MRKVICILSFLILPISIFANDLNLQKNILEFLDAVATKNETKVAQFINEDIGVYVIYPSIGVVPSFTHLDKLDLNKSIQINDYYEIHINTKKPQGNISISYTTPLFDCDDTIPTFFPKNDLFIDKRDVKTLSSFIKTFKEEIKASNYKNNEYINNQITTALMIEDKSIKVLYNNQNKESEESWDDILDFYFTNIDGKWYVTFFDYTYLYCATGI